MSTPISSNTAELQEILRQVNNLPDVSEGGSNQPLTFTGAVNATYDGSEAVTVEIPQGGGSSCDLAWKHIADIIVNTEISEVILTEDNSGNPFAYKEILLIMPSPNMSGYFYIRGGSSAESNNVQVWLTNGKSTFLQIGLIDGHLAFTNLFRTDGHLGFMGFGGGNVAFETISKLIFGASAGFTAEQTIKVYGR